MESFTYRLPSREELLVEQTILEQREAQLKEQRWQLQFQLAVIDEELQTNRQTLADNKGKFDIWEIMPEVGDLPQYSTNMRVQRDEVDFLYCEDSEILHQLLNLFENDEYWQYLQDYAEIDCDLVVEEGKITVTPIKGYELVETVKEVDLTKEGV